MLRRILSILSFGLWPKKRTSAKANVHDEQTNEDSYGLFRKGSNDKRARLDSYSNITLQYLPNELLECILVKAVAMEVKDLKLIKNVWKDKVDLVINRLKSVSSHWTSILSTDVFRNKVHKLLDGTAQEKIRLEMLHKFSTPSTSIDFLTSLKDEIFTLEERNEVYVIRVYDRNNTATVKDVMPLEKKPECMEACNVSNCVYVGLRNNDNSFSVLRISKDVEDQFNVSPWTMKDRKLSVYMLYVAGNGNLLIRPMKNGKVRNVLRICDTSGYLQREVKLPRGIPASLTTTALQKSNGNLVMMYNNRNSRTKLLELDANGSAVRLLESSVVYYSRVNFADIHGRILITHQSGGEMELFDSECNLLGIYSFQHDNDKNPYIRDVHFTSERNEIVRTLYNCSSKTYDITIFCFTEE